ncbi:5-carboxymethyl-2-hydroxymuconate isomerase [Sulfitobacter sp. M57]|uniref:5-carboxymethyl-2-hydroxymuconate isomerase n=1 Tax=unclassified Sulfitobacter TaxID=196795 RepID=UPI0023E10840|nr:MULTISPECIES: 5-carboxymethyl-2-hydroxymuconate isomerase [unclassified Sulfitobacter]MDF3413032.1 5-carboxymethyl-2-hydroxymuconate isomerase [Sulfitobacter sp. KE5]MDF3421684.1 5-carboxymethyl-2-hydroxymuconate isomerase [Sulfitobacter sp. KE43]MDF3431581.1 5-carboxymethyl-2-hydroxymuconate isomerase [Sulfitobacter sp. KE42]MDF3457222.1 5-carboxymethyl-2-hydroxymuconate isomerase [Sulfitobacter sp. S74]MDF3461125.1 5-carboxymethyl-2-hydroxymuconate isomerase [Sulfitobacter sp. Ks18]
MPHFHIEYSANLEDVVDMAALCDAIRAEAALIETFPTPGIRVRATRVDHVSMADGDPKHGFIDLSVRLREGRADDVKRDAITRVFAALKDFMAPAMATRSIALSAEMRDINADLSPKFGTVRDHLEDHS